MRRFFPLFLLALLGAAQTPTARIKIDVDRGIGEVDPLIFGNFAEHLGRMIYGGIYEEGSPLSDKDGFRTDVMEVVKRLKEMGPVTVIGFGSHVDKARLDAAKEVGCDEVMPRSRFVKELEENLPKWLTIRSIVA